MYLIGTICYNYTAQYVDILLYEARPTIETGISSFNEAVNPIVSEILASDPSASVNPLQVWIFVAANIWILGIAVMLLYAIISYLRLHRKVRASIRLQDKTWVCDDVRTPFILGIFNPKIYLPSGTDGTQVAYIIAHENAHLKRLDHWWKPLGFSVLTIHWFNPLVWMAYVLLCRDIEIACDEKVIRDLSFEDSIAYSDALLSCSISRRTIMVCPLAFGEVGVKERVKHVLNYKKPAFWIIIVAFATCIVLAVCFLTSPKQNDFSTHLEKDDSPISDESLPSYTIFHATILEVQDGYFLVEPVDDSMKLNVADQIQVPMKNMEPSPEPEVGDIIEIKYTGEDLKTYPVQLSEVHYIRVVQEADGAILSLNDVIMLSQKGEALSWEDFEDYRYMETGSGLYIRVYEINDLFELWIGGGSTDEPPMYIHLKVNNEAEDKIDIRTENVTDFISAHKDDVPLLESWNNSDFQLNFAGNTSLQHNLELTEEKPYWCVEVDNIGEHEIIVELNGEVFSIPANTKETLYAAKPLPVGEYTISFASVHGMEGTAHVFAVSALTSPGPGDNVVAHEETTVELDDP